MFGRGFNYKLRYSAGVIRENRGTLNGGAESTASIQTDTIQTYTTQVQEMQLTSPQDSITGAYNLIDEADSVVNQLNARTEELEEMMGDM
jgi:hypothetical protein